MSNLPEQTAWESGIHQLEEEDRAKAGPGGVLNIQGNSAGKSYTVAESSGGICRRLPRVYFL